MPKGSYGYWKEGMQHFVRTKGETVVWFQAWGRGRSSTSTLWTIRGILWSKRHRVQSDSSGASDHRSNGGILMTSSNNRSARTGQRYPIFLAASRSGFAESPHRVTELTRIDARHRATYSGEIAPVATPPRKISRTERIPVSGARHERLPHPARSVATTDGCGCRRVAARAVAADALRRLSLRGWQLQAILPCPLVWRLVVLQRCVSRTGSSVLLLSVAGHGESRSPQSVLYRGGPTRLAFERGGAIQCVRSQRLLRRLHDDFADQRCRHGAGGEWTARVLRHRSPARGAPRRPHFCGSDPLASAVA